MARPSKFEKIDLEQVEKLAGFGLIDTEIASVIGISTATLNNYKKKPEFLESLKKGKAKADSKVIESLYLRATGYEHEDTYFSNFQGVVTATPYMKHYPPDATSMIFWLKNRQPDRWKDNQDTGSGLTETEVNSLRKIAKNNVDL